MLENNEIESFLKDNNVKYKGESYKWIISHPANGSLAIHNLWHLYPNIQPGDIVIWDEHATMHKNAGDFSASERRIMLRAMIDENK